MRLGQVFVNLLVNAAQAIEDGRPEQNEIAVSTGTDPEGRAWVRVRDTGRGILAEHLPRIFDPFFTTKDVDQGSGLGLAICHGIVKAAGGSIEVDSQVGRGTTFTVTLPPSQAAPPLAGGGGEREGALQGRILVVDDEVLLLKVVKRSLSPEHEVTTARSGREALALLQQGPPFDLVLCDLMMPEISGMDLYERTVLRDPEQARRFVFLSGGAFTARAQEFLAALQREPIAKPFTPDLLRSRVQAMLREVRSPRSSVAPRPA